MAFIPKLAINCERGLQGERKGINKMKEQWGEGEMGGGRGEEGVEFVIHVPCCSSSCGIIYFIVRLEQWIHS